MDEAVREYCCKKIDSQQMKIVAKPNCGDKNMTVGHKLERAQTSPNKPKQAQMSPNKPKQAQTSPNEPKQS